MAERKDIRWNPPETLTSSELKICKLCRRTGRLFPFLRRRRLTLFDEGFQAELSEMYADTPRGRPPLPAAMLGMATLLQAYQGVSDAEAVTRVACDRRWQMVLDCVGAEEAPFSQGALVDFRRRLLEHGLHLRLVDRSVAVAKESGDFGYKQLRVALDSAPLWGAGRVEDTFNLIGHALAVVVECAAVVVDLTAAEVRAAAGLELLGKSSLKASLDIDWDDREEQHRALQELLAEVARLRDWVAKEVEPDHRAAGPLRVALDQLQRVVEQDLEPDPDRGGHRISRGTAKERQISISDPEMRHGRKSRSQVIKGYKRFLMKDLDHGVILGVAIQPANEPERNACEDLREQARKHGEVVALFIDRGFLASQWAKDLADAGKKVVCRPWQPRNRGLFSKSEFAIDLASSTVTCPAGTVVHFPGATARFPAKTCDPCRLRAQCTRAKPGRGRSISINPQEALYQRLQDAKATSEGRKELRQRVTVEHSLAHVCNRQGRHARYRGVEKNVLDLCRYAVIENCFLAARLERKAA